MSKNKEEKTEIIKEKQPSKLLQTLRDDRTRFIVGLLFLFIGALLALSFSSFLGYAGKGDASSIANGTVMQHEANNWIGALGAVASEVCINQWIGIAAFLYVFFFLQLGFRLTRNLSIRPMFRVFVRFSVWSIWISLACGFFFIDSYQDSYIYLGGHHGYDLELYLERLIGWWGVLLLIIITFLILLVFVTRSVISKFRATFGLMSSVGHKIGDKMRHPHEASDDEESLDEEVAPLSVPEDTLSDETTLEEEAVPEEPQEEPVSVEPEPIDPGEDTLAEDPFIETTSEYDAQEDGEETTVEEGPEVAPVAADGSAEAAESGETLETGDPTFKVKTNVTDVLDAPVNIPLEDYDPTKDLEYYKFPQFDLLKEYDASIPVDMAEQNENKEKIRRTLSDYGVEIQDINATVGPTITLFEIVLVSGTKINTIKRLSDEIAMSIASRTGIRIIAPIPGKSAIGIEVPNKDPQTVSMRECIQSRAFQESKAALPVALGKTITNEVFTFDLAKAPHMLVAGATGQGKSVGLNAIITSLLYKKHPSQLKIVLVDPKMVEFSVYANIDKHYLAKLPDAEDPIITDVSKVVQTLKSLCAEMEDRYALLREAGCRKLEEYNDKFIHRKLNPNKHIDAPIGSKEGTHHHYLPYIVAIIDEYGDLIMTAGKEVELPIARIAQKARAVGIHMIIATQRPSAKIVTGIIKANFPARIAFRVSSATDSSIILDQSGAQNLVGR
ncbi:MAG: DNA translocase FtsK, partial [Bacteroidales bacterium]|nr:DNA translocase FtsK [Bacteroidales bacterium]